MFLLTYLALEGSQRRQEMARLLWDSDNPRGNLDVALSQLKRGLGLDDLHFLEDFKSSKDAKPMLRLNADYLTSICDVGTSEGIDASTSASNSSTEEKELPALLYIDCLVLEQACKEKDIKRIAHIYKGAFLAGFESAFKNKKTSKKDKKLLDSRGHSSLDGSSDCRAWLRSKRDYFANCVLEIVAEALHTHESGTTLYGLAQALLERLLASHNISVFTVGQMATLIPLLPEKTCNSFFAQTYTYGTDHTHSAYLKGLYATMLQKTPDFNITCQVCDVDDIAAVQALKDAYEDDDWFQKDNIDVHHHQRQFLQKLLYHNNDNTTKGMLLQRLFGVIRYEEHNYAELFQLAWAYYQSYRNFGVMDWFKVTRVCLIQVQTYCRLAKFKEAELICCAWERVRYQKRESSEGRFEVEFNFYHAYSLERQGNYQQALDILNNALEAGDTRHHILGTSLYSELEGSVKALMYLKSVVPLLSPEEASLQNALQWLSDTTDIPLLPEDYWVCAEIHTLKGKIAYQQEDFRQAISCWHNAGKYWELCRESGRYLGVLYNVACAYERQSNIETAQHYFTEIEEKLRIEVHFVTLKARVRLAQLIMYSTHQLQDVEEICRGYVNLFATIDVNSVSSEVLGKIYYNYGYTEQGRRNFLCAITQYHQARQHLHEHRQAILLGYTEGETARCYLELMQNSEMSDEQYTVYYDSAYAAVHIAIKILSRMQDPYVEDYKEVLQQLNIWRR